MGLVEGARVIRREVSASIRFVLVQSCYKCQKWRNANPDAPLLQSLLFLLASGRQMPICAAISAFARSSQRYLVVKDYATSRKVRAYSHLFKRIESRECLLAI